MKRKSLLLVSLTVCFLINFSSTSFGQSKKALEANIKALETTVDSLSSSNMDLSLEMDSVRTLLYSYHAMYQAIQDKVLYYDFKPENLGSIIDSLQNQKDSTFTSLMDVSSNLRDTISSMNSEINDLVFELSELKKENAALKSGNELMKEEIQRLIPELEITDEQIAKLKKLKEIYDLEVIDKEEFDRRKMKILNE